MGEPYRFDEQFPEDARGHKASVIATKKADGSWSFGNLGDAAVDITIEGEQINVQRFIATNVGDTTLITPASGKKLRLFRVAYSVAADVSGELYIKLGTSVKDGMQSPKSGGLYGFNVGPDSVDGAVDAALIVNLPSSVSCSVCVAWKEV